MKLPGFTKPFFVELNASDMAVEAISLQFYDDSIHFVAYFSMKYIIADRNYAPHYMEFLAILKACQKWRYYIEWYQTTVFTDYKLFINVDLTPIIKKIGQVVAMVE